MRSRLVFIFLFFSCLDLAQAQSTVAQIFQAYGGAPVIQRLSSYMVTGTLKRGQAVTPFTLIVDGTRARFQTPETTSVYQGYMKQWWRPGGKRSWIQESGHGLEQRYFLPYFALPGLAQKFIFQGNSPAGEHFHRDDPRQRYLGYHRNTPTIELTFDPATGLLIQADFQTREQDQTSVSITYSGYRQVNGTAVPTTVKRYLEDRLDIEVTIESIDFSPVLDNHQFDLVR